MDQGLRREKRKLHTVKKNRDIKVTLLNKFLFEGDSSCLQILLNLYNIEDSIENVLPSYISMKKLKEDIVRCLNPDQGRDLVAQNISSLIHDEITRLELYIYLEGYKKGYHGKKWADQLEILSFNYVSVEDIYKTCQLDSTLQECQGVMGLKEKVFLSLEEDFYLRNFLKDVVLAYSNRVLKPKIFHVNKYLDRQLMIDCTSKDIQFIEAHLPLKFKDIAYLYRRLLKFLIKDCLRVYQKAYWDGINDQVLNRYQ